MFFTWFEKNRHFRPKKHLAGQIFPIVLICLAGLMVAVVITIGVGEGAKAKTYASNSADAGSLTAASYWAAAFNKLVARNKELETYTAGNFGYYMTPDDKYNYYKELDDYYPEMRLKYATIYDLARGYLTATAEDNARYYAAEALEKMQEAYDQINAQATTNCTVWANMPGAASLYREAAVSLVEAGKCVGAFYILSFYMRRTTDFFKSNQLENFCNAQNFMAGTYDKARKFGLMYALSNSGTSRLLTQAQGDDFNFWLGSGTFFDPASPSSTYTWGPEGKQCSVTATLELSNIQSYQLRRTEWNYPKKKTLQRVAASCGGGLAGWGFSFDTSLLPISEPILSESAEDGYDDPFNIYASFQLMQDILVMSDYLLFLANIADAIHQVTSDGTNCCNNAGDCCVEDNPDYCPTAPDICCYDPVTYRSYCDTNECSDWEPCCPNNDCNCIPNYFDVARAARTALLSYQSCARTWLNTITNTGGGTYGGNLTIPTLRQGNTEVWNKVWGNPRTSAGLQDCAAVSNDIDENGYKGLMIINIQAVTLDGPWTTTCTVTTSCEGGGSTTSTSTSQFDGGSLSGFEDTYYARIISVS